MDAGQGIPKINRGYQDGRGHVPKGAKPGHVGGQRGDRVEGKFQTPAINHDKLTTGEKWEGTQPMGSAHLHPADEPPAHDQHQLRIVQPGARRKRGWTWEEGVSNGLAV